MPDATTRRRIARLQQQLAPSCVSMHRNYNAVMRYVGEKILITYSGGHYGSLAGYFGYTPDRDQLLADKNLLFRGFTDGAPNVVLVENPSQNRRVYVTVFDAMGGGANGTTNDHVKACDVFSDPVLRPVAFDNFRDLGGIIIENGDGADYDLGRIKVAWGQIYRHGRLADVSDEEEDFLRSLVSWFSFAFHFLASTMIQYNVRD